MTEPVSILGRKHIADLPSFGQREELVHLWFASSESGNWSRAARVSAAAIGLSCGIGAQSGTTWAKSGADLMVYGERVYSYLREQGASVEDVATAALPLLQEMTTALFPREKEVDAAAGFSEGGAVGQTSPPTV